MEALLEGTSARTEYYNIAADDEEEEEEDGESTQESSHAWTPELESSAEQTEEEDEYFGVFMAQDQALDEVRSMSKGAWRHVRTSMKCIQECMSNEMRSDRRYDDGERSGKTLSVLAVAPRRAGPWRLLEIFTLTCMVTVMGFQRGWGTYEPITMPGWNLDQPETRAKAREYLMEVDPDFVVLSPPSDFYDRTRERNQGTPWQMRELQRTKAHVRAALMFLEEVVHYQHMRGRAVVLEHRKRSLLWKQVPIQSALSLSGMKTVQVDMCAYGKCRPDTGQLVKRSMTFQGTAAVCDKIAATCAGGHEHGSVTGGWKSKGSASTNTVELTVAEWAENYPEQLVERLLAGAQQFLEKRRRAPKHFPVGNGDGGVPEEGFMDAGQVVHDDWSLTNCQTRCELSYMGRSPRQRAYP